MPWRSRPVILSASQRNELKRIAADNHSSEKEKCRAIIVLLLAEGLKNREVAERLNVHENTVVKWRGRWTGEQAANASVSHSSELAGRPRSVLTNDKLNNIKSLIKTGPKDHKRWTVRSLAKECNMPSATMQRALVELDINLALQSGTYE